MAIRLMLVNNFRLEDTMSNYVEQPLDETIFRQVLRNGRLTRKKRGYHDNHHNQGSLPGS